ncbi:glycosyltransferase [Micromonospora sp. STR1_7]|uniref:Glycosyltransferase n=1 Tax=Micromonospora parastrephiae TaxID=2806101 RepID=A0ABS1XWF4_9ACTN|nr:glycosyltransferase [Micromonospora parastrephiae]MBM0233597.1 glycosyltransferase [Micromonospora parastrephiae]
MSSDAVVLDVVVPAFNEALRLPDTLILLRAALADLGVPCRVTVVDNASTDRTSAVVTGAPSGPVPVRLLWCGEPGKGFAVRTGVLASDARYVGFCDADLATAPHALGQVLNLLVEGADAVVGSRAHPESVVEERHSLLRRWGAVAFRGTVRQVVRTVGETQCGFKFFRIDVARRAFAPLRCGGFAFDVEVLGRAERSGARLVEIPVRWVDVPGSRFSPVRHGWQSFVDVAKIRWRLRRADVAPVAPMPVVTLPVTADVSGGAATIGLRP